MFHTLPTKRPESQHPRHRFTAIAKVLASAAIAASMLVPALVVVPAASATTAVVTAAVSLPTVTQDVSKLSAFDAELLRLTNIQRAATGAPALREARGLTSLSAWWSRQMSTANKLAHNPNGWTMTLAYGAGARTAWGESVVKWSPASTSAQTIFDAYWASATHRTNLSNKSYLYVGVDTFVDSNGVSWNTITLTDKADAGQTYDPAVAATPIGHFESATVEGATVRLTGWAIDPDIATTASTLQLKDTSPDGSVTTATAAANVQRADVGALYPASGNAHGFNAAINVANRGAHSLCVTVLNQGAGVGNVALGCLPFTVGNPIGSFDSAAIAGGLLAMAGWAIDPDVPMSPNTVTVTDQGPKGTVTTAGITANVANASVAAAVPGTGGSHGFAAAVPTSGVGDHTICIKSVALRTANLVADLGCKTVNVKSAIPGIPTKFTATANGATTTATITWAAPPTDGGSPITGYRVARDGTDTHGTGAWSTVVAATATSQTFSVLRPGSTYALSVQAINAAGTGTAAAGSITVAPVVPGIPVSFVASRNILAGTAKITWAAPATDGGSPITGYRVARDGTDTRGTGAWSTVVPATATSQTFTVLRPASSYTLSVQAITAAGIGPAASSVVGIS